MWLDLWDTEEPGVESLTDKRGGSEEHKVSSSDLTEGKNKDLVNDEVKAEQKKEATQPVIAVIHNNISSAESIEDHGTCEKSSEGEILAKGKQHPSQEPTELITERAEQISNTQLDNFKTANKEHEDVLPCEISKTSTDRISSSELQTTFHKRDNSCSSVDSSWSKVSEEELKASGEKEGMKFKCIHVACHE